MTHQVCASGNAACPPIYSLTPLPIGEPPIICVCACFSILCLPVSLLIGIDIYPICFMQSNWSANALAENGTFHRYLANSNNFHHFV